MKNFNFHIRHQCPQCGAPAVLEETDRLFTCGYCRVTSYLLQNGVFRYILPAAATAETEALFYAPYWRFKGVFYSWVPGDEIQHRFMDISHLAIKSDHLPISLGFRSQALKLTFAAGQSRGRFFKHQVTKNQVMDIIRNRFNDTVNTPLIQQEFIGETLSMIYLPIYSKGNRLFDAVLNTPLSSPLPASFDIETFQPEPRIPDIRFIAALCPACGWDLTGARDSIALHCNHCNRMWQATHKGLRQLPVSHVPEETGSNTIYLPFWKIKARTSGIDLKSYADLVSLANLPKVIQSSWHEKPFYFWCPAFKIRPGQFLLLSRAFTLSQPGALVSAIPEGSLHPVTLPVSEAAESLKISLANFIKPSIITQSKAQSIAIHPETYRLTYIPFHQTHLEIIYPRLNLSINKQLITLAHNL